MVIGIEGNPSESFKVKRDAVSYKGIGHDQDWKYMMKVSERPFCVPAVSNQKYYVNCNLYSIP